MRSIMVALILSAATALPAAASEDLQDVRFRIHNLARVTGRQSAELTGRLAPSTQPRLVAATVTIGTTTVTLGGKIGRSGRLHVVGRRLDLSAALEWFDRIDIGVAGGFTGALTFAATECTRSLRGRLLECRGGTSGVGELVDGVYDVAFDYGPSFTPGVGRLTSSEDGTRQLLLHQSPLDFASLTAASDLGLSGYFVQGGDAIITVTGSARVHSSPNVSRLDGTIAATSALAFHVAFAMERPLDGTPSTLGGSWTIHLQGVGFGAPALDGTMTLAFDVPADGVATTAPTTIERTGGGTGYTVPAGTCLVAASGRVHCDLPISPASGIGGLQLHGALDSAGASGRGTFAIGSPPISVIEGTWTAARMAESGAR